MELFEKLGISDHFLKHGLKIEKGIAHDGSKKLGEIDFSILNDPFNYILACPQFETEKILSEEFIKIKPNGLIKGAEVHAIHQDNKNEITCQYTLDGTEHNLESDFVIGCDGKNSFVRQEAGIFYGGKRYPDTYIMGDFEDNTDFGDKAAVFLPTQGMIECFPLPDKNRRWVVKTDKYIKKPSQKDLSDLIEERIGYDLKNIKSTMLSSFGVQHFMAEQFVKERILLCGDSAHVVSPIGGQGMNLGWIGAWKLSKVLSKIQNNSDSVEALFLFQKSQKRVVKKAARRAEMNMILGRKQRLPIMKKLIVFLLLKTPLRKVAAQQFAMKNLFNV
jgi:2-polyprenyl-6-methoxyphenol hydroxylase-like FAD-dependent oxidoreductase